MKTTDYFKSTTFFYNNLILKKIIEYNLSLEEFVLLVYLMNFHVTFLDIKKVSQITYLTEKQIFNAYNGLIDKKIITINIDTLDDGKVNESISLDNFINQIDSDVSSKNEYNIIEEIKKMYKDYSKGDLSEEELVIVKAWLENGFKLEDIERAFESANYNGVFTIRYIDKYLNEDRSKKEVNSNSKIGIDSTNWLDDGE